LKYSEVASTVKVFPTPGGPLARLSQISAGELVVDHGDSHALESQLEIIFKIAKHFNAILLLDEADAFIGSGLHHQTGYPGSKSRKAVPGNTLACGEKQ
jgi:hypothetical protein